VSASDRSWRSLRCWALLLPAFVAGLARPDAALARNILITNDDGLTSNVKALHEALKARGHDVIVVVPCRQQSGMGGALQAMQPLGPLASDCLNGAASVGDPGAGPMTRPDLGPDFHYVDGTPVMATLYGIDVVGHARWNKAPDMVISGPNIGRNVGGIVVSSGTVSNVQYALIRGIPAIALSAGAGTDSGPDLDNPLSAAVAGRVLELVGRLEDSSGAGPLLPAGTALNVNFPDALDSADWKLARIGTSMAYDLRFVTDLQGPSAAGNPALPGLQFRVMAEGEAPSQEKDESAIARSDIAISVMQLAYDAPPKLRAKAVKRLRGLLDR
jgi:5'-nucleotidase